jgi:SNF2 family DNA or RNA helicase
MENNVMELWSLLSITAPGLFPSPTASTTTTPARSKSKPTSSYSPSCAAESSRWSNAAPKDLSDASATGTAESPRLGRRPQQEPVTILRSLTLLRQLSLHAGLIDGKHQELPSAKVDALLEQLRDVIDGGHRALVFSQFTGFLDIVRKRLVAAGIEYCHLDGKTRNRATVLKNFKIGAVPVFLISLKAGGFGLNLTEADYCFLLDPWWSPATEAQAVDRAHRIGQARNVMVYRLIAKTPSRKRCWR